MNKTKEVKAPTLVAADLSLEELELAIAQKKEAAAKEAQEKRKKYEGEREDLICGLGMMALAAQIQLEKLKATSFEELTKFRGKMLEYGDLRKGDKNKGSFTVQNERYRIEFKTQIRKAFDERAELAESKLRKFLDGYLKKKAHKDVIDIVTSLLERNTKTGEYDINLINRLYAMKDRFQDKNWVEAIELFQESYSPQGTAQYVRFYVKNSANAWEAICLDIAGAKLPTMKVVDEMDLMEG